MKKTQKQTLNTIDLVERARKEILHILARETPPVSNATYFTIQGRLDGLGVDIYETIDQSSRSK